MFTLKEYLKELFKIATGWTNLDGTRVKGNKGIKKFLAHHTATGTWNGVVVWRRLPSFFGGKTYRGGGVPGGARRFMDESGTISPDVWSRLGGRK